jgi:aminopeptidase N
MSAGRRTLRNACLDLLVAGGETAAISLATQQYDQADNMTDRMGALAALASHDVPQRGAALDDFYDRFRSDALVVDKWLSLQAMIAEPGTLPRIRRLTEHSAFSFTNPNRVRALIGAFAHSNQTQFNRPDGEGYAFVADTILSLDGRNPQVAARLAAAFRSWRVLEPRRRAAAEAALRRIADTASLSPDLADIAHRALAEAAAD